jgi:hypothetical protein
MNPPPVAADLDPPANTLDASIIGWYNYEQLRSLFTMRGGRLLRFRVQRGVAFDARKAEVVDLDSIPDGYDRVTLESIKADLMQRGYYF